MYNEKATCYYCNGDGVIDAAPLSVQYGGPYNLADYEQDCPHCGGDCECPCTECINTASENAYSRMCESEPPVSMRERYEQAWAEKQSLR